MVSKACATAFLLLAFIVAGVSARMVSVGLPGPQPPSAREVVGLPGPWPPSAGELGLPGPQPPSAREVVGLPGPWPPSAGELGLPGPQPPSAREVVGLPGPWPPSAGEVVGLPGPQPPSAREVVGLPGPQPPSARELGLPGPQPPSAGEHVAASAAPTTCVSSLLELTPCLAFFKDTKTTAAPEGCCAGLRAIMVGQPLCLCHIIDHSLERAIGVAIPVDRAVMLIGNVCGLMATPNNVLTTASDDDDTCTSGVPPLYACPAPTA